MTIKHNQNTARILAEPNEFASFNPNRDITSARWASHKYLRFAEQMYVLHFHADDLALSRSDQ